ncbi:MAG TPA: carboxypeptidase-like regulatory domain-containing protein, partial [Polyangiaceae bacterium LLY-WYZ-15_(1-7)]|nr:carboxypeptidase-like regulatory domain-containing protein [Polyangiaceae bacterium LLY-WYZ-15_(1-7)]
PSDAMRQAGQARREREAEAAEARRRDAQRAAGVDAGSVRDALRGGRGEIATATASTSVPVGTIAIQVVDERGQGVPGASIRLGIMNADSSRDSRTAQTDAEGLFAFQDLPTGSGQSYRVNIPHQGATYSSTPFRLEPDRGHLVRVVRLPVTRDTRGLLQTIGQTMLEYRAGRVHITQQAQLANLGRETIVFGDEGLEVRLPRGFTAFQSGRVMSDQTLVPDEEGFHLKGSLPPGRTTLTWAYDVPLDGTDVHLSMPMPFRTFRYVVMTDHSEGMALRVEGMPDGEARESNGRKFLVSQIERSPGDAPWDRLAITVEGIPGPGPLRWLAVGGAIVLLIFGLLLATRGGDQAGALARAREARREELLEDAAEVERLFAANEIGPKFRTRRMEEIVAELASLLRLDEAASTSRETPPPARTKRRRARRA